MKSFGKNESSTSSHNRFTRNSLSKYRPVGQAVEVIPTIREPGFDSHLFGYNVDDGSPLRCCLGAALPKRKSTIPPSAARFGVKPRV